MRRRNIVLLVITALIFSLVGLFRLTSEIQATSTPTGFTATSTEDSTGTYVLLSWNFPSSWCSSPGIAHYDIYRGTSAGGEVYLASVMNMTYTSYEDHAVTKGSTYYYRMDIVDCDGTTPFTNEVSVTVGETVPYPGKNLGIDDGAQMEWQYFNVNQTAIQALANNTNGEYSGLSDLQEGYRIHLDVNAIREYSTLWHLDVDVKGGLNLSQNLNSWGWDCIYKSPATFQGLGSGAFFSTDWRADEIFVIPANVVGYLKGIEDSLTPSMNVQAIGRTLIINDTFSFDQGVIITLNYNEQGILENANFSNQGNIIAQVKLTVYIEGIPTALVFSCIVIVSIAFSGFLCVRQWTSWRKGRLQLEAIDKQARSEQFENSGSDVIAYSEKVTGSIALLLAWGCIAVFLYFVYRTDFPRLISFMDIWTLISLYGSIYILLLAVFRHAWYFKHVFGVSGKMVYFILPHMSAVTIHWAEIESIEVQQFKPARNQTVQWFTTQFSFKGKAYSQVVAFNQWNGFPKGMSEQIKRLLVNWSDKFKIDFIDRSHSTTVDTGLQNN